MNPRVKKVKVEADHQLRLTFENGETKLFDMKPYLSVGIFKKLKEPKAFQAVRAVFGTVQWKGGQDLCPDTLYEEGVPSAQARSSVMVHEKPGTYRIGKKSKFVRVAKGKSK